MALLAAAEGDVDFVISISGPGVTPEVQDRVRIERELRREPPTRMRSQRHWSGSTSAAGGFAPESRSRTCSPTSSGWPTEAGTQARPSTSTTCLRSRSSAGSSTSTPPRCCGVSPAPCSRSSAPRHARPDRGERRGLCREPAYAPRRSARTRSVPRSRPRLVHRRSRPGCAPHRAARAGLPADARRLCLLAGFLALPAVLVRSPRQLDDLSRAEQSHQDARGLERLSSPAEGDSRLASPYEPMSCTAHACR